MNNSYESLAGTRKDSTYSGAPFQKIIVFGLTSNTSTRIAYENAFMGQFIDQGVNTAISSIDVPNTASLRNRSLIENVIREGGYDAVVTVEVKNMAENETAQWLKTWSRTPVPGPYSLFDVLSDADKSPPETAAKIRFEVAIWDGKTARQVWAGTTIAVDKYEILRESHTAAHSTVKTLMNANLLKATL